MTNRKKHLFKNIKKITCAQIKERITCAKNISFIMEDGLKNFISAQFIY